MATVYTYRSRNIFKTWIFLSLFAGFIIALGYVLYLSTGDSSFLTYAGIFAVVSAVISYFFSANLVLAVSRAKEIEKKDAPELVRLVENLSIAAGLPTPKVYIINELQPNAFATGRNPGHSVVAVTKGLLEKLSKRELEGVLAHEMSHIGNRDILISSIVAVLAGFVAILSDIFLRMSFFGGSRRDDENRGSLGAVLVLVSIFFAILSPIIATIIQLAISRKREFLADASAVLLTRDPEGLALALEKISADAHNLKAATHGTAHLYIASPFKGKDTLGFLAGLFSTHPPVEQRIKLLKEMST